MSPSIFLKVISCGAATKIRYHVEFNSLLLIILTWVTDATYKVTGEIFLRKRLPLKGNCYLIQGQTAAMKEKRFRPSNPSPLSEATRRHLTGNDYFDEGEEQPPRWPSPSAGLSATLQRACPCRPGCPVGQPHRYKSFPDGICPNKPGVLRPRASQFPHGLQQFRQAHDEGN